jgi:hypothetical protein
MQTHLVCKFKELVQATFCKNYLEVYIDEQVYMAILVIKQGGDEKMEV